MKNKKAQMEISPWGCIFGVVGFLLSLVMTKLMNPPLFWKLATIVATTGVLYFIGVKASDD